MSLEVNKIHVMDCIKGMKKMDKKSVDVVVTSPLTILVKSITVILMKDPEKSTQIKVSVKSPFSQTL